MSTLNVPSVATVAPFVSMKCGLYRHPRKILPPLPKTLSDFSLEDSWEETKERRQFLCVDDEDANKTLVFATTDIRDILFASDTICMGGTFYTCPSIFLQLYVIHCLMHDQMCPACCLHIPDLHMPDYSSFTVSSVLVEHKMIQCILH